MVGKQDTAEGGEEGASRKQAEEELKPSEQEPSQPVERERQAKEQEPQAQVESQLRKNKLRPLDVILTGGMCISLGTISWLLAILFTQSRADESVVFGSLGFLLLVTLGFVIYEWVRHRSIWIAALQGAIVSAFAAFPIFRGEPNVEPIICPGMLGVLGGVVAAITTAMCWLLSRFSGVARRFRLSSLEFRTGPLRAEFKARPEVDKDEEKSEESKGPKKTIDSDNQ